MRSSSTIPFDELRRFLNEVGFTCKRAEAAWVFHHPKEGLIVFRLYGENEAVDEGDVRSTRRFLDMRGVVTAKDFDAVLRRATPA
jgi:hypothetical protein